MGYLTTHVLDTALGRPGSGIKVQLFSLTSKAGEVESRELLCEVVTNADGRTDVPILPDSDFKAGRYELVFLAGDYFRRSAIKLDEPAFVNDVVIRFGIADTSAHYHVPLLVSPYSYSTYRGS